MEVEHDRLVDREQGIEVAVGEPVRMLSSRLQLEEIDHVDEANLQVGEFLAEQSGRGQGLLGGDVAGGRHDHIGFAGFVVAGPIPYADALGAMGDGRVHIQILQMLLFVADDDVHVVLAAQAMIGDGRAGSSHQAAGRCG